MHTTFGQGQSSPSSYYCSAVAVGDGCRRHYYYYCIAIVVVESSGVLVVAVCVVGVV